MKVFKFGGASVKDAQGVRNLASIVEGYPDSLVIVVSAMGKTTNALESLTKNFFSGNREGLLENFDMLKRFHFQIIEALFGNLGGVLSQMITSDFEAMENRIQHPPSLDYDFEYDQIVSFGEILSTKIVSA